MIRVLKALAAIATLLAASFSLAQVDVVESTPQVDSEDSLYPEARGTTTVEESLYPQPQGRESRPARPALRPASQIPQSSSGNAGDLFFQVQALQEELMYLRGVVEEHEQNIRQLKQQRLDDYMNLDRRIADIGTGSTQPIAPVAGSGPAGSTANPGSSSPDAGVVTASMLNEEDSYRAAYELLRGRQFPEATGAFEAFLVQYGEGELAPNGYYWLGELYMLDGRNDLAGQRFELLLQRFPENRKAPDAMFKLAKVYHIEGRNDDARSLLERVGRQYAGSSAARLASEYLQQNF